MTMQTRSYWNVSINLPVFLGKRSSVSAGQVVTRPSDPLASVGGDTGVMVNVGRACIRVRVSGSNVFVSAIGYYTKDLGEHALLTCNGGSEHSRCMHWGHHKWGSLQ
jgi:hypothetical protein